ncbi:hypothetical protein QTP86_003630 [Hemibagrus guttatus]|nr:hypothetical protein QTP86_003630 [Hemibagrus guttatus]
MGSQIEYRPPLPLERQRLVRGMPVGHMTKFIITYPTAFWKEKGFSGEIVAHPSESCPFGVTFDASSPSGSPALVGFISGVQDCYWNSRELEDRRDAVVSSLVKYLGHEAASYIHYEEKILGQQSKQGCPDFPLPRHFLQLFRKDPEAFPGQQRDIVSPACPGSFPGSLPGGACPEHLPRETSRRHPKQMHEPPQLSPFDVKEQRLNSELLPGDRAP